MKIYEFFFRDFVIILYFILQHYTYLKFRFIFLYKILVKERKEYPIIQYMDFLKKIKNFNFEKTGFNEKLLHNTYILYFIAFLSFGKFFFELMIGDMYYVTVYIIIAFLLSFFNKNMIVILFFSLVFANILKYGRVSTIEGFDDEDASDELNEVDKALGIEDKNEDEGVIDEILGEDDTEKEKKKKKEKKNHESDDESEVEKKKKKKNKHEEDHEHDDELDKNEQLLKNQELLLKNMKEYKPFLDTIQGLAKNVSGFVKKDSE